MTSVIIRESTPSSSRVESSLKSSIGTSVTRCRSLRISMSMVDELLFPALVFGWFRMLEELAVRKSKSSFDEESKGARTAESIAVLGLLFQARPCEGLARDKTLVSELMSTFMKRAPSTIKTRFLDSRSKTKISLLTSRSLTEVKLE